MVKVGRDWRVEIPVSIRNKLNIKPGDKLVVQFDEVSMQLWLAGEEGVHAIEIR